MSFQHELYRFSVTIQSDDLPVVGCLRALAQYSQRTGNNRIPWGGTKDLDWERAGYRVTFHFTSADFREGFLREATRVLLAEAWMEVGRSDSDAAQPRS